MHYPAAPAVERAYTLESTSILQLTCVEEASIPPLADLAGYDSLVELIRREGLDRLGGDFLVIGCSPGGGPTAKLAEKAGKHLIQQDSRKANLPEGTRLAFAFVDGSHDPARGFRLVWKHLLPRGWAGFHPYAGGLPDVTAALNALLTEYSAEIDRVERIKEKRVLLIRKRTARTEWKKL